MFGYTIAERQTEKERLIKCSVLTNGLLHGAVSQTLKLLLVLECDIQHAVFLNVFHWIKHARCSYKICSQRVLHDETSTTKEFTTLVVARTIIDFNSNVSQSDTFSNIIVGNALQSLMYYCTYSHYSAPFPFHYTKSVCSFTTLHFYAQSLNGQCTQIIFIQ